MADNVVPPSTTNTSRRGRRAILGNDEFMAAAIGDTAWLRQSLKGGKNPAMFDRNGLSSIHLAALHGRIECLKLLAEKYHVSVNLASSTGWRPIHLCINSRTGKRSLECLQYLLDLGADPSAANEDLMTPTHQAAIEGSVKCLEILLAHGAEIGKPDSNGHLPLDYAKIWGHRKCARILASETWKREREAELIKLTQLQELKKLKDTVDSWDQEEDKVYKQEQTEQQFHEWLDRKGLPLKPTGPALKPLKESELSLGAMANQLFQPNSPARGKVPAIKVESVKDPAPSKKGQGKSNERTKPDVKKDRKTKTVTDKKEDTGNQAKSSKEKKKPELVKTPKIKAPVVKITGDRGQDNATLYMEPIPDLPQEVIDKILLEGLSPHERPLSFKCKNIIDAQHKKLFDEEAKPLVEVYAHLSNDCSSKLFPGKGQLSPIRRSSSADDGSFDNRRLASALRHIGQAEKYPQIYGEDYKYAFEVL